MSKSLKNIGAVAGSTVISRLLGLFRDMLTTAVFGASALNSAFVTAFTLPNLFRRLLGEGALTAAFVPTMSEELERGGRERAFRLLDQVASWLAIVTAALVALAVIVVWLASHIHGLDERWYQAAHLTEILFPYLIFICLAAAFAAALNILNRFTIPALTAVWLNLAIIIGLGGLGLWMTKSEAGRMYFLCGGVLVGGFFQFAVPLWALGREGWRPRFDLTLSPALVEIAKLMGPGFFGTAIFQINILTSRGLAFSLNESAATLLYLANRLMEVPLGIFTIAVSTVTFPQIARLVVKQEWRGLGVAYRRGMMLTMVIAIPASIGLIVLREPIIQLLFERGNFGKSDVAEIVPVLAIFACGLPFYSFVVLVTRAFYSLKDTKTPVKTAALAFVINLVLSLVLMRLYSTNGLAAASNIAIVVQTIVLQILLSRRQPELSVTRLMPGLFKIGAASLVMAGVAFAGWSLLAHSSLSRTVAAALAVGLLIPLAGAVYFGLVAWMHIEGIEDVRNLLHRLVGRQPVPVASAASARDKAVNR